MEPTENADPSHYLRLLLLRLLETQKCLTPLLSLPALSHLRLQIQTNAYTLLEIKQWLETTGDTSVTGPPLSSARGVAPSGVGSSSPPAQVAGPPPSAFAWRAPKGVVHSPQQVVSSLPSSLALPLTAQILAGRITFRPNSDGGK